MHSVIAKLNPERQRELLACLDFAKLSAARKDQLLDAVVKVRASLDYEDRVDVIYDQNQRMADAAALRGALSTALTILGRNHQITADMIGNAPFTARYGGIADLEAFRRISRHMLAVAERLTAEPQALRISRKGREARLLRLAFTEAGVRLKKTTPPAPNPTLDLARGFWRIRMDLRRRNAETFTTVKGHVRVKV